MSDTEFPMNAPAGTAPGGKGLPILGRIPWAMSGEMTVTSAMPPTQLPSATFANNFSKTFEIHEITFACVGLDNNGVALPLKTQPSQFALQSMVRVFFQDLLFTQPLTKVATKIATLTEGDATNRWRWKAPYNLRNQGNIVATLEGLTFPSGASVDLISIAVVITFKGYLLVQGTGDFTP